MRSKISFFNKTVFLNDCGRYWPLTAGYTLVWLLILPLSRLTELNNRVNPNMWLAQYQTLNLAANVGYWAAFFSAILFAMAAFSYLTSPRATNGLHALSARRETLYVTHFLSGLCCQLAAQLLAVLLTAAVLASHGAFDARIMALALLALVLPTLFFYSFGALCMMFTGQILAAPVFYFALNVLVVGVESLIRMFAGNFLYGWAESNSPLLVAFSPIAKLVMLDVRAADSTGAYYYSYSGAPMGGTLLLQGLDWLLIYAAVGLVLAALGLLVYRTRHSEATGTIVAIGWARPIFRYGVAFCAALAFGQLLYYLFFGQYRQNGDYSLPGTLLCMAAAGLLGYFTAEMLLRKSFRVWKTGWRGALVVTALLVALGGALSLDLTGYEGYIPSADQIASANVQMNLYSGNSSCYMTTEDPNTIRLVTEAHRALVNDKADQQSADRNAPINDLDAGRAYGYFYVAYTLKNGTVVQRRYNPMVLNRSALSDPSSPEAALTALYNDPNATLARTLGKYGYSSGSDPRTLTDLRFTGGYADMWYWQGKGQAGSTIDLTPIEAQAVYEAILRDVAAGRVNDSLFSSEPEALGHIELYATWLNTRDYSSPKPSTAPDIDENGRTSIVFSPTVTEAMTETVAVLRAIGVSPRFG